MNLKTTLALGWAMAFAPVISCPWAMARDCNVLARGADQNEYHIAVPSWKLAQFGVAPGNFLDHDKYYGYRSDFDLVSGVVNLAQLAFGIVTGGASFVASAGFSLATGAFDLYLDEKYRRYESQFVNEILRHARATCRARSAENLSVREPLFELTRSYTTPFYETLSVSRPLAPEDYEKNKIFLNGRRITIDPALGVFALDGVPSEIPAKMVPLSREPFLSRGGDDARLRVAHLRHLLGFEASDETQHLFFNKALLCRCE